MSLQKTQNMFVIAIFFSIGVTIACPDGTCLSPPGLDCVPSIQGIQCAECKWSGWINGSTGECQLNPRRSVFSCSITELSCTTFTGECRLSVFGTRCAECDFSGFLVEDDTFGIICECYDPILNPHGHCSSPLVDLRVVSVNVTAEFKEKNCIAFQSETLGCFANVTTIDQPRYGSPFPKSPNRCCSEIYGPKPGELVENGIGGWEECNQFGTFDPNEPFAIGVFRTCSGHGAWDKVSYSCICDPEWNGVKIGQSVTSGIDVYSCRSCFGFFGPDPPLDSAPSETRLKFCSVIMTPDENGDLAECGGHGSYLNGQCICDASIEDGFWGLLPIVQTFERVLGNGTRYDEIVTVETCSRCSNMGNPESGCSYIDGILESVLLSTPTQQPVVSCLSCRSFGHVTLVGMGITFISMIGVTIPETSPCCQVAYSTIVGDELRVYNGTCVESETARRHLGDLLCQNNSPCEYYLIHEMYDYWTFKLSDNTQVELLPSVNSELGRVCPPTPSPTRPTTRFPTLLI